MAAARDSLLSDRPPSWAAWLVSLAIHLGLFLAMIYLLRTLPVRGAAEEPTREVGIVLKQMTDDGPTFQGEEDQQDDDQPKDSEAAPSDAATADPMMAALPDASEFPSTSAALPKLPTIGIGSVASEIGGDVGQMTSGGAPSSRVNSKTTVRVFGIEGTGTRFVYAFDRSISMAGAPLRAAKEQLIASLESLDSIHQFQIIFFHHEPQSWDLTGGQGRIAFATDANKRQAEKFVRSISATGGTFRHTALQLALRLRPDVIFFLTDTDDPMDSGDLAEAIRRAQRDGIAVNTIEYGSGPPATGDNFLVELARQTRGRYVYVDTAKLGR